jgi:hypothetical protein
MTPRIICFGTGAAASSDSTPVRGGTSNVRAPELLRPILAGKDLMTEHATQPTEDDRADSNLRVVFNGRPHGVVAENAPLLDIEVPEHLGEEVV